MNNKGFISIALILTIVILAVAIIAVMIRTNQVSSNFEIKISENVRERITNFAAPSCTWETPANIKAGEPAFIFLVCKHMDGISLDNPKTKLDNINYAEKINFNPNNIWGRPIPSLMPNGFELLTVYNILFPVVGTYHLVLQPDSICTTQGNCNSTVTSRPIVVGL